MADKAQPCGRANSRPVGRSRLTLIVRYESELVILGDIVFTDVGARWLAGIFLRLLPVAKASPHFEELVLGYCPDCRRVSWRHVAWRASLAGYTRDLLVSDGGAFGRFDDSVLVGSVPGIGVNSVLWTG